MSDEATPSDLSSPASASAGETAGSGPYPRRFTYSCPSGNRSLTRCAQCVTRAVFPTPAVPETAEISTAAVTGVPSIEVSSRSISARCSRRAGN